MANNVTVYDIAKEAGVSSATVSRVINNSESVTESTRAKVLEVIEKYNYKPNAIARSLYKKESETIGVIVIDITNVFFSKLFLELEKAALKLGYNLFLCNSMGDNNLESNYLKSLAEKQVDGIIFLGGRINEQNPKNEYVKEMQSIAKRLPLVTVNGDMAGVDSYVVKTDEYSAFEKLIKYLNNLGHKEIAFLGGKKNIVPTDLKIKALKDKSEELNLKIKEDWIINGEYTIEDGMRLMEKLLQTEKLPTAVMCINDAVAIGVLKAAKKYGFDIPKDLSIVGFDGIYLSEIFEPPLTTIRHNYEEIAQLAVNIIEDVKNGEKPVRESIVDTDLIIRESCNKI